MVLTPLDRDRLQEALALAQNAIGLSDPNPRVGCIIGCADGSVLGRGYTQQAGGAHAERAALDDAISNGLDAAGATAWVTLEPCAHHGRTPPCCDALIEAGIARVVVALEDPFPEVAGEGLRRLRAAGVQVTIADGDLAEAARELNIGFLQRVVHGRPWVRMKVAASLDGRTALDNGASQWITGEAARVDGHRWRRRAGAVLSGIGTVLADDPRLDVRHVPTVLQPLRVIVDSGLRLPISARLLAPPGRILVVGAVPSIDRRLALEAAGAEVQELPDADGAVDLPRLMAMLGERGVNELHLEAGARLNQSMLAADLVDELLFYLAATLIGPGKGVVAAPALHSLADARRFRFTEVSPCGDDMRVLCRRNGFVEKTYKTRPFG